MSLPLLTVVVSQLDWRQASAHILAANTWLLGAAVAALGLDSLAAAFRLRLLHDASRKQPYRHYLRITVIHAIYLSLLPARLGELAYLYLLRTGIGMSAGSALANLLCQRLLDLIVVAAVFVAATLSIGLTAGSVPGMLTIGGATTAVALFLLGRLEILFRLLVRIGTALARWRRSLGGLVFRTGRQGVQWCNEIRSRNLRAATIGFTLGSWISTFAAVYLTLTAFGLAITPAEAGFIGAGLALAGVVPLPTIGGFGISEASVVGMLIVLGHGAGDAIAVGLVFRFFLFGGQLVICAAITALLLVVEAVQAPEISGLRPND